MTSFPKPKVVVSKCLEFEACRYSGDVISSEAVKKIAPYVEFIPVCPEVEIGLGTPRKAVRIVKENDEPRLVQPGTGKDVTEAMTSFTDDYLSGLGDVDGFILKSRSPTCGIRDIKIYGSQEKSPVQEKGKGFFGGPVQERFPGKAIEEEGRLRNFAIRDHFLIKIFTLASFRQVKQEPSMKKLVAFHTSNKYLFMAYNQTKLKQLGRLVANQDRQPIEDVFAAYEAELYQLLRRAAPYTNNINVCQHIMGYFSDELQHDEKEYFLEQLERYRERRIPLSNLTSILKAWVIRFSSDYLAGQTFFEPYPESLVEMLDSGKGKEYR